MKEVDTPTGSQYMQVAMNIFEAMPTPPPTILGYDKETMQDNRQSGLSKCELLRLGMQEL